MVNSSNPINTIDTKETDFRILGYVYRQGYIHE